MLSKGTTCLDHLRFLKNCGSRLRIPGKGGTSIFKEDSILVSNLMEAPSYLSTMLTLLQFRLSQALSKRSGLKTEVYLVGIVNLITSITHSYRLSKNYPRNALMLRLLLSARMMRTHRRCNGFLSFTIKLNNQIQSQDILTSPIYLYQDITTTVKVLSGRSVQPMSIA